jgi:hypothetical protein
MKTNRLIKFVAILSIFVLVLTGCGKKETTKKEQKISEQEKKELDMAAFFAAKCGFCHDLDRIEKSHYRGDQWENVLKRMYSYDNGANLTKDDYPVLLEYLKKTYK